MPMTHAHAAHAAPSADGVWTNLRLAPGATAPDSPALMDAAIVVHDGRISYLGQSALMRSKCRKPSVPPAT